MRLYKSQPAVSHALAQLRDIFQDPLLIRQGGGMALTPRARELQQPLEAALGQLNALLHKGEFDASRAVRRFRVALSDYAAHLLLPPLLRQLRAQAPGIDMAISQASREAMLAQLADGKSTWRSASFRTRPATSSARRCSRNTSSALPTGDRCPQGRPAVAAMAGAPHVLVAMRPDAENEIDAALKAQGLRRHVALTLPHWSASTEVLAGTDLILTVASRALANVASGKALRQFKPPFDLPPFSFQQAWHGRRDSDPALCWLRSVVISCC